MNLNNTVIKVFSREHGKKLLNSIKRMDMIQKALMEKISIIIMELYKIIFHGILILIL